MRVKLLENPFHMLRHDCCLFRPAMVVSVEMQNPVNEQIREHLFARITQFDGIVSGPVRTNYNVTEQILSSAKRFSFSLREGEDVCWPIFASIPIIQVGHLHGIDQDDGENRRFPTIQAF
jgi:hypothetical protein